MTDNDSNLEIIFMKAAARLSDIIAGRICKYQLIAMGHTVDMADDGKTGKCQILGVHYSPDDSCDIYHLRDMFTEDEFSVSQIEICLTDI